MIICFDRNARIECHKSTDGQTEITPVKILKLSERLVMLDVGLDEPVTLALSNIELTANAGFHDHTLIMPEKMAIELEII
ncbi:MAG: hypothetical protein QM488_12760 [Rhizobiaceae bacterium]